MSFRAWLLRPVLNILKELHTMATITAAELNDVSAQVAKIGTETSGLIAKADALQVALDAAVAAGSAVPQDVIDAFEALKVQVGVVDALVPDAVAP
jgi:hypothetical protein